jgi:hypothetical protein
MMSYFVVICVIRHKMTKEIAPADPIFANKLLLRFKYGGLKNNSLIKFVNPVYFLLKSTALSLKGHNQ